VRLGKLAIITETSRNSRYSRGPLAADDVIRAALRIALSVYISGVQINFLLFHKAQNLSIKVARQSYKLLYSFFLLES